jgi:serpin B
MLIVVPDEGRFAEFDGAWQAARYDMVVSGLKPQGVILQLPKFAFTSGSALKDTLASLGMAIAFARGADFSGINGQRGLFITNVYHKAFVKVDEVGTEAAAATALPEAKTAEPQRPKVLTIDRPFLFAIRHVKTGAILFLGRVVDPRG